VELLAAGAEFEPAKFRDLPGEQPEPGSPRTVVLRDSVGISAGLMPSGTV